ncbi:hypothetical protein HRR81_000360 [Exophiala dermatitidis]|nr:hypothetical protein HRR79_000363 [Exophiala dermatitidis]KAJ4584554.1 hypothetical protein HRR81_000360 [Exophiala dermatitidis]
MPVRIVHMATGQFRPAHPPTPAFKTIASRCGMSDANSLRLSARTESRLVNSTFSGRKYTRRSDALLTAVVFLLLLLPCFARWLSSLESVSEPFRALRVVKMIVRADPDVSVVLVREVVLDVEDAQERVRYSSIKRQQTPRPRPLRARSVVSAIEYRI